MAMRKLPGLEPNSKRLRNVYIALSAVLLFGLLGWWAAQRIFAIDHYRALIVQRVEAATGMPCTIDAMALRFVPAQQVVLSGLHIGESDRRVDIAKVTADVNARALLHGVMDIPNLLVEGVEATIPEDWAAPEAKVAVEKPVSDAATPQESARLLLGTVSIPEWTVKRGEAVYAKGTARVEDLLGTEGKFSAQTELPGVSPGAKADVTGTLKHAEGKYALEGKAALDNVDLAQFAQRKDLASAVLNANVAFSGTSQDDIAFTLAGTIATSGRADVAGQVSGKAWWKQGEFTANDFTWESSGLHLLADMSRKPDGELAVHVREAKVEGDGLKLLLGTASSKSLRLDPRDNAFITVQDLLAGRAADGAYRWVKGDASIAGIDVLNSKETMLEDLRAKCHLEEGVLHIVDATASGMHVAGDLSPAEKQGVRFNLAATAKLSNPAIAAYLPPSIAQGAKGELEFKRLSGTWRAGAGLPADLAIEGTLAEGQLKINTDRFQDTLSDLVMSFASDGKTIRAKAAANSGHMGKIAFEGSCDAATRATDGTVSFSMNRLAAAFVPSGGGADVAQAMLAAFEGKTYTVAFRMPQDAKTPGSFTIETKEDKLCKASAVLIDTPKQGVTTGEITADFEVPFAPAAQALPVPASGDGKAVIHFVRGADARFSGRADLSGASLRVEPYLYKRAGDALSVDIDGSAGETWKLEHLTLNALGESVKFESKGDGLAADQLAIDLAKLTPLFPDQSEASGSLSGAVATAPLSASLRLAKVRVKTPSGVSIDQLDGGLDYAPGSLRCDNLRVAAYESDFTLNGAMKAGKFEGSLRGDRADLNLLMGIGAAKGGGEGAAAKDKAGAKEQGLSGNADIALNTLVFRRATFEGVKAQVRFDATQFAVEKLACAAYGGTLSGAIIVDTPAGAPGRGSVKLAYDNVDLKLLDDLSSAEPRGMYGPSTGSVDIDFPVGQDVKPYMGLNGDITATAKDGSLGKAGASGKVLAALRATEIAQLQIPSLRDKGLSFNTANVRIFFKEGVVTFDQFELSERTHSITATGAIDFPQDDMDVTIKIQLLESVREIVGAIPLMEKLSKSGGIYVYMTGSPFDMKVSAARVRPLQELRETPGTILHGVRKIFGR